MRVPAAVAAAAAAAVAAAAAATMTAAAAVAAAADPQSAENTIKLPGGPKAEGIARFFLRLLSS